jgi:glutaconate CoA-transferase subunit B
VDYITSPGFGEGAGWRERVGLAGGGPAAVITTLGVFGFDAASKEMLLASYHPGQSVASVKAATGWALRVAPDARETPTPSEAELEIVRACDPAGFWTR